MGDSGSGGGEEENDAQRGEAKRKTWKRVEAKRKTWKRVEAKRRMTHQRVEAKRKTWKRVEAKRMTRADDSRKWMTRKRLTEALDKLVRPYVEEEENPYASTNFD